MQSNSLRCLLMAALISSAFAGSGCRALLDLYDPWERLEGKTHEAVIPVSRDSDTWLQRHHAINARVAQGDVDLIFVGDSITHHWEDIGAETWARYYAPRNAVNLGISGDRTQHVLWRLDHGNVDGIEPKLAVVLIGTNNLPPDRSTIEETIDGVFAVCRKLHEKLPDTQILVLSIFPRSDEKGGPGINQRVERVNDEIEMLGAARGFRTLNINPNLNGPNGEVPAELFPDQLHLSAMGYQVWAEMIEPTVKSLMEEKM